MKKVVFDKNEYKSFKDFYHDVCIKLDKDSFIDFRGQYEDLCYRADILDEFLWYCHQDNLLLVFKNFDVDKIKNEEGKEHIFWRRIFTVVERFVKEYPNNKLVYEN